MDSPQNGYSMSKLHAETRRRRRGVKTCAWVALLDGRDRHRKGEVSALCFLALVEPEEEPDAGVAVLEKESSVDELLQRLVMFRIFFREAPLVQLPDLYGNDIGKGWWQHRRMGVCHTQL
jgi:hypothetical protein